MTKPATAAVNVRGRDDVLPEHAGVEGRLDVEGKLRGGATEGSDGREQAQTPGRVVQADAGEKVTVEVADSQLVQARGVLLGDDPSLPGRASGLSAASMAAPWVKRASSAVRPVSAVRCSCGLAVPWSSRWSKTCLP